MINYKVYSLKKTNANGTPELLASIEAGFVKFDGRLIVFKKDVDTVEATFPSNKVFIIAQKNPK